MSTLVILTVSQFNPRSFKNIILSNKLLLVVISKIKLTNALGTVFGILLTNWLSLCFCLFWCISFKVYVEHLLEPLLQTILALSGPRTTIMVRYSTLLLNYAHISYDKLG